MFNGIFESEKVNPKLCIPFTYSVCVHACVQACVRACIPLSSKFPYKNKIRVILTSVLRHLSNKQKKYGTKIIFFRPKIVTNPLG